MYSASAHRPDRERPALHALDRRRASAAASRPTRDASPRCSTSTCAAERYVTLRRRPRQPVRAGLQRVRHPLLQRLRVQQHRQPLLLARHRQRPQPARRRPTRYYRAAPHRGRGDAARQGAASERASDALVLAIALAARRGRARAVCGADRACRPASAHRQPAATSDGSVRARTTRRTSAPCSGTSAWWATTRATRSASTSPAFHSAEVPKGSGMNYTDGITPFVLAKGALGGRDAVHHGDRLPRAAGDQLHPSGELQHAVRAAARLLPGRIPNINRALLAGDQQRPRTWPDAWPDRVGDRVGPGLGGFVGRLLRQAPGRRPGELLRHGRRLLRRLRATSPTPTVDTATAWGCAIEVRGFQWANPQAGNVIFWHYDITNERHHRLRRQHHLRPLHGLRRRRLGAVVRRRRRVRRRQRAPSTRSLGLNLVYTWDKGGHGRRSRGRLQPAPATSATRTSRRPAIHYDGDGQRPRTASPTSGATAVPGSGSSARTRSAPTSPRCRHYDLDRVRALLRSARAASRPIAWACGGRATRTWTGVAEFDDVGGDGVYGSPIRSPTASATAARPRARPTSTAPTSTSRTRSGSPASR